MPMKHATDPSKNLHLPFASDVRFTVLADECDKDIFGLAPLKPRSWNCYTDVYEMKKDNSD